MAACSQVLTGPIANGSLASARMGLKTASSLALLSGADRLAGRGDQLRIWLGVGSES